MIYPVDSAIQHLNNLGPCSNLRNVTVNNPNILRLKVQYFGVTKQKYTILPTIPGIWITGNSNNLFPCYINPFREMHNFEAKAGLGSDTGSKPGSLCLKGKCFSLTWILENLFPI